MNCRETGRFLDAYVDGELDVASALQVEEHLGACSRCRMLRENVRALQGAVRRHVELQAAPASLRAHLQKRYGGDRPAPASQARTRFRIAAGFAVVALATWIGFVSLGGGRDQAAKAQGKVLYHITDSSTAGAALRTLRNHLEASPDVKVVVVAHNEGIDFLLRGARDESGELYETVVRRFKERGVEFRVCNNTLARRKIDSNDIVPGATLVPSGIAEIGRLQVKEGYVYMRL